MSNKINPYQSMETLNAIAECLVETKDIDGHLAECGVLHGLTAKWILERVENKVLHLFDTFAPFKKPLKDYEHKITNAVDGLQPSNVIEVAKLLGANTKYIIHEGLFKDTLPTFNVPLSFIHADADTYDGTVDICKMADRLLVKNGIIVFHDYRRSFPGIEKACNEYITNDKYELIKTQRSQAIFKRL